MRVGHLLVASDEIRAENGVPSMEISSDPIFPSSCITHQMRHCIMARCDAAGSEVVSDEFRLDYFRLTDASGIAFNPYCS